MNSFVLWFTKITALPVQWLYYRKKVYYENGNKALRGIKGKALIISNHKSIFDYPLIMFTFFKRSIYTLAAEVLFAKNKLLSWFIKSLGCIKVDRDAYEFSFMDEMTNKLNKGKVGLIFPEARLHLPEEKQELLEFKHTFAYIALQSDAPIIPVYVNGAYGSKKQKELKTRAKIVIGEPINAKELYDENKTEKENIQYITDFVKNKIMTLKGELDKYGK